MFATFVSTYNNFLKIFFRKMNVFLYSLMLMRMLINVHLQHTITTNVVAIAVVIIVVK